MEENKSLNKDDLIESVSDIKELESILLQTFEQDHKKLETDQLKNKYLGRKGIIPELFSSISKISQKFQIDRVEVGKKLNKLKVTIEEKFEKLDTKGDKSKKGISFDPTLDKYSIHPGKPHPISKEKTITEEIFMSMGFDLIEGPVVDTEFNVFDSLNLPKTHPARDNWDTVWTKKKGQTLRVHTTAFQNRLLLKAKEEGSFPIRAIQTGLCIRNEATDARHEHTFYQVDGFYVEERKDRWVSISDLLSTLKTFFSVYFEKEMQIRAQPAYFPFVEPGLEFAISCIFCDQKGCSVCSKSGWVEIVGMGMTHPNVFKAAGLDPNKYSGFAFGYGIDRMAQLKLNINDIRLFRSNDIRFLQNT